MGLANVRIGSRTARWDPTEGWISLCSHPKSDIPRYTLESEAGLLCDRPDLLNSHEYRRNAPICHLRNNV